MSSPRRARRPVYPTEIGRIGSWIDVQDARQPAPGIFDSTSGRMAATDVSPSLGIDFGTSSVRALFVDVATGREVAFSESAYVRGDRGVIGDPADPNVARHD